MNYEFHPIAEAEHLETVAYFESKRAGLGATYLTEFEATMTTYLWISKQVSSRKKA